MKSSRRTILAAGLLGALAMSLPLATKAQADAMTAKQVNDAAAFIRGLALQHGRNAAWAERAVREAASLSATEALREKVVDVVALDIADLRGFCVQYRFFTIDYITDLALLVSRLPFGGLRSLLGQIR